MMNEIRNFTTNQVSFSGVHSAPAAHQSVQAQTGYNQIMMMTTYLLGNTYANTCTNSRDWTNEWESYEEDLEEQNEGLFDEETTLGKGLIGISNMSKMYMGTSTGQKRLASYNERAHKDAIKKMILGTPDAISNTLAEKLGDILFSEDKQVA